MRCLAATPYRLKWYTFRSVFLVQNYIGANTRFDVAVGGTMTGPRLNGTFAVVDYINARADGRLQLHIHGVITTDDGEKISLFADGTAMPAEGTSSLQLRENVSLTTSSPAYSWVNHPHIWALGTADVAQGTVNLTYYAA